jgi:cysteine-rich repeat protein
VTLDDTVAAELGLERGRVYEIVLFHAERHTGHSNFKLSLKGFGSRATECASICGDGHVTPDEACDDGDDNGTGYGFCGEDCTPGARCGDGSVNEDSPEECDNGQNLDGYATSSGACAPGCKLPPSCGDGFLDAKFGEECDSGEDNAGEYGGCKSDCTLAPRCGDGLVDKDEGEECDDGNSRNDDLCDVECQRLDFGPAQ